MQGKQKSSGNQFPPPRPAATAAECWEISRWHTWLHYPCVFLLSLGGKWSSPQPVWRSPIGPERGTHQFKCLRRGNGPTFRCTHPLTDKEAAPPLIVSSAEGLVPAPRADTIPHTAAATGSQSQILRWWNSIKGTICGCFFFFCWVFWTTWIKITTFFVLLPHWCDKNPPRHHITPASSAGAETVWTHVMWWIKREQAAG